MLKCHYGTKKGVNQDGDTLYLFSILPRVFGFMEGNAHKRNFQDELPMGPKLWEHWET